MKKIIYLLVLLITMISCDKDNKEEKDIRTIAVQVFNYNAQEWFSTTAEVEYIYDVPNLIISFISKEYGKLDYRNYVESKEHRPDLFMYIEGTDKYQYTSGKDIYVDGEKTQYWIYF